MLRTDFWLPSLTCKKLGSRHSVLTTSKNLNKLKNQHRANHCPPPQIKADRQMQRPTSYQSGSPQEKPPKEPVLGSENLNDEFLEAQCGQV